MTLKDILKLNQGKSLFELEVQLENSRRMAVQSVADSEEPELVHKYMDAWRLASDMYYQKKYAENYKP